MFSNRIRSEIHISADNQENRNFHHSYKKAEFNYRNQKGSVNGKYSVFS